MTDAIRLAFIDDAIQNGKDVQADRIYTLIALMLHDAYGMGQKRIIKGLQLFDQYCGRTAEEWSWTDVMKELRDKTGLVVQTDGEDRLVFEYKPEKGDE